MSNEVNQQPIPEGRGWQIVFEALSDLSGQMHAMEAAMAEMLKAGASNPSLVASVRGALEGAYVIQNAESLNERALAAFELTRTHLCSVRH